jgi:hypothetical protein
LTLPETSDVLQGRWGPYVLRRLDELEAGDGRELWEGPWPGPETVQAARRLAAQTFPLGVPAPSVVPTDEGRVAFIWPKAGWWVEVEVSADGGEYWAFQAGQHGATIEGNLPEHAPVLQRLLRGMDGMQT